MLEIVNFEKLETTVAKAGSLLIVLGVNYTFDELAAALALGLSLEVSGKKVTIFSVQPAKVSEASLFGVAKVTNQLNSPKLIISVPNALASVDKVTHYLDGETLNIVVHPLDSGVQLLPDKVTVQKQDAVADAVILINRPTLEFLDKLSPQEQKSYANIPIVISGKVFNTQGGGTIVAAVNSASISETMTWIIQKLQLPIDADCASNLFQGMRAATDFTPPAATASTFEAASLCLAQKPVVPEIRQEDAGFTQPSLVPKVSEPLSTKFPSQKDLSYTNFSQSQQKSQAVGDLEEVAPSEIRNDQVQSDWLVPKIFKSSKLPKNKT